MLKFTGLIMVVLACGSYVFTRTSAVKEKFENLCQIKSAVTYLKHEMSFSAPQINILCRKMAERTKGEVSQVLSVASDFLDQDKTLDFEKAWQKVKGTKELFSEEAESVVCDFFKNLGKKSIDIELDNIKKTEKNLEDLIIQEEEKTKKDIKLIYTLGGAACAAIVIMAI